MLASTHEKLRTAFAAHKRLHPWQLNFFLKQKATFLQVVLALSKSPPTAGFTVYEGLRIRVWSLLFV